MAKVSGGGMAFWVCLAIAACNEHLPDRYAPPSAPASWNLRREGFAVTVARDGRVVDARDAHGHAWIRSGDDRPRVRIESSDFVPADAPSNATANADESELAFEWDLRPRAAVMVRTSLALVDAGGKVALKRVVRTTPTAPPMTANVAVAFDDNLVVPGAEVTRFVPHQDGFGEETRAVDGSWLFALAGRGLDADGAARLAVPLISDADSEGHRLTRVADAEFSTSFAGARVGWIYRGDEVPFTGAEERVFYDVFDDASASPRTAMDALYATVLADVPAGPSWLHDIAWQHYDYMSHGGRGWFADIDALSALLPAEDRGRVMFTLHGWFDVYGHYAYDAASKQLLDTWTVFPNAAPVAADFPDLETMTMTRAEVHRRIAYARERGYRVGFYFADGMATGEDVAGVWALDRVLYKGGWQGPDTTSPTWSLNPAHPWVAAFFLGYLDALLREYGNEIDALVWDETFHVPVGMVGPPETRSYADRGMMQLTRALTKRVTAFRADVAFLTSDVVRPAAGAATSEVPPYALMGHGTYQDSGSDPNAWRFGVFPNFRNTLWSCNWQAESHFEWTRYGVENFATPVATSNGFGDNFGIAALSPASRDRLLALFAERKTMGRQDLRWLASP